jgi:serine/threonine protein kinase
MYKTKKQKQKQKQKSKSKSKSKNKTKKLNKNGGAITKIGTGAFGCAFSKNNNDSVITKISLHDISENNEMLFNEELFDLAKTTPKLRDHLIIILSEPKNVTLSELSNDNNKEMVDKCPVFRKSKDGKLLLFDMPNGGNRLDIFLNSFMNSNNSNNLNNSNNNKPKLLDDGSKIIIQKALDSLQVLHKLKKYHGDSHLGNFLVKKNDNDNDNIHNYKVRLIDFGLSGSVNTHTNKVDYIKDRIAKISFILAGYTFSITPKKPNFFLELSKDENIEYKLDLIHFLNSLTLIIKNKVYYNYTGQDPRISKEFFLKLLLPGDLKDTDYTFSTYEKTILDDLTTLYH